MASRPTRGPLSADRRIFFGQGRSGYTSRALASRLGASIGSRSGSSTADLFFSLFPPTLLSLTPSASAVLGGIPVDLAGMHFQSGAAVKFGATPATILSVTPTHIIATVPAHAVGQVNVTVTNPDLQASVLVNGFTYAFPVVGVGTAGSAIASIDGINWLAYANPGTFFGLVHAPGLFVEVGNLGVEAISPNERDWVVQASITNTFRRVARNGTVFCSVGRNPAATEGRAATSPDGIVWTQQAGFPIAQSGQTVAWNGSVFASMGPQLPAGGGVSTAATSPTGVVWTTAVVTGNPGWTDMIWVPRLGLFVCVGSTSDVVNFVTSPNGLVWTDRTPVFAQAQNWLGIADNGSILVAIGLNVAASSTDGITWTQRTIPAAVWSSVAALGSLFIAVDRGSLAATSSDGINWTSHPLPASEVIIQLIAQDSA